MSNLSQGPIVRQRAKGFIGSAPGVVAPEQCIEYRHTVAGANTGVRLFVAPKPCKVVAISETHTVAGAASSKISIRKHLAAHVAAPDAALSGTNVTSVAEVAADATVNVPASTTPTAANATLAAGDKLMVTHPATLAGSLLQVWVVYS